MMKEADLENSEPAWLAEWIARAAELPPQRSIILGSKCCTGIEFFARSIANYLNEFDEYAGGHWHAFDRDNLQHFAGDPSCRDMLLNQPASPPETQASNLDRIASKITRLGGAVLGGHYSLDSSVDRDSAYRVCLCPEQPACIQPCHMWLNPDSFSRSSLVAVIADSFLDWTSRRPTPGDTAPSSSAQDPASGAEPDSPPCGSL